MRRLLRSPITRNSKTIDEQEKTKNEKLPRQFRREIEHRQTGAHQLSPTLPIEYLEVHLFWAVTGRYRDCWPVVLCGHGPVPDSSVPLRDSCGRLSPHASLVH